MMMMMNGAFDGTDDDDTFNDNFSVYVYIIDAIYPK
jgi:hypothetical protein